jgi:phenol 2-monooxygenase
VYVFADKAAPATSGTLTADFAQWWQHDATSPRVTYTPSNADTDAIFDTKVIYQQDYTEVEPSDVPQAFKPTKTPFGLIDVNQIFASGHGRDIFRDRDIHRGGAIVIVRPDQYVSGVFPLDARDALKAFFAQHMLPAK